MFERMLVTSSENAFRISFRSRGRSRRRSVLGSHKKGPIGPYM